MLLNLRLTGASPSDNCKLSFDIVGRHYCGLGNCIKKNTNETIFTGNRTDEKIVSSWLSTMDAPRYLLPASRKIQEFNKLDMKYKVTYR